MFDLIDMVTGEVIMTNTKQECETWIECIRMTWNEKATHPFLISPVGGETNV